MNKKVQTEMCEKKEKERKRDTSETKKKEKEGRIIFFSCLKL